MAGNAPFSKRKLDALIDFWVDRRPDFDGPAVASVMMSCDFTAYRMLGRSITGSTWLKGAEHPEVREVGVGYFERAVLRRRPLHLRLAGYAIAAATIYGALRRG